jgi:hypothetical protein
MSVFPLSLLTKRPASAVKTGPRGDLDAFFAALSLLADPVENLSFRFGDSHDPDGFVQRWGSADHWLQIHRIWARYPNRGDGTRMLQTVCDLADEHDIGIRLKVIPIGRKPYPLPREQLKAWYERFGFAGQRWNLQRLPRVREIAAAAI